MKYVNPMRNITTFILYHATRRCYGNVNLGEGVENTFIRK